MATELVIPIRSQWAHEAQVGDRLLHVTAAGTVPAATSYPAGTLMYVVSKGLFECMSIGGANVWAALDHVSTGLQNYATLASTAAYYLLIPIPFTSTTIAVVGVRFGIVTGATNSAGNTYTIYITYKGQTIWSRDLSDLGGGVAREIVETIASVQTPYVDEANITSYTNEFQIYYVKSGSASNMTLTTFGVMMRPLAG